MKSLKNKLILMVGLLIVVIVIPLLMIVVFFVTKGKKKDVPVQRSNNANAIVVKQVISVEQFRKLIIQRVKLKTNGGFLMTESGFEEGLSARPPMDEALGSDLLTNTQVKSNNSARVSETNIQVKGVDEPDIIKTNGQQIFWSRMNQEPIYNNSLKLISKEDVLITGEIPVQNDFINDTMPPPSRQREISIVQAIPPENTYALKNIKTDGFSNELLLKDKTLVSLEKGVVTKIKAYDISLPKDPSIKWELSLEDGQQLLDSRLVGKDIYVIVANGLKKKRPCPVPLFVENKVQIVCTDIFYTKINTQLERLYTIIKIDIVTGQIKRTISLPGSWRINIYVTPQSIYLSETSRLSDFQIMNSFVKEKLLDVLPKNILQQINNLAEYNISDQSKKLEMEIIMGNWFDSSSFEGTNKLEKKQKEYTKEHFRELETNNVIKLQLSDLLVQATGVVPGHVLNQFSFDEYQGNLRIATTSGNRINEISESDVYVLDNKLKMIGSVTALGKGEKIYAVRFVADKGYVVTFKRIDPFYILDLQDPKKPIMSGKLKIPGFSSYLHPVKDTLILGVGKENNRVKLSLFDVANPKNPREVDKYILTKAYWSEISQNHHAFMIDPQKEIFFIPANNNGYIIAYKGGKLSMVKEINGINAKRALYIGDYLYIMGDDRLVVVDERTWEIVKSL